MHYRVTQANAAVKAYELGQISTHQYNAVMAWLGMLYDDVLGSVRTINFE